MPVEVATYISDLVTTNPSHTDGISQADTHMRLLKSTLKNTFPNVTGAVSATQATLNNGYVPIGGIIMWSGGSVPANWSLCDGSNGTPNLRDRFVIGSGGSLTTGATGGAASNTAATASDGAHSHGGATGLAGSHTHAVSSPANSSAASVTFVDATGLTANSTHTIAASTSGTVAGHTLLSTEIPAHDHGLGGAGVFVGGSTWGFTNIGGGSGVTVGSITEQSFGGGGSHAHGFSANTTISGSVSTTISGAVTALTGTTVSTVVSSAADTTPDHQHTIPSSGSTHSHSVTVPCVPVYFALAFIMRIS